MSTSGSSSVSTQTSSATSTATSSTVSSGTSSTIDTTTIASTMSSTVDLSTTSTNGYSTTSGSTPTGTTTTPENACIHEDRFNVSVAHTCNHCYRVLGNHYLQDMSGSTSFLQKLLHKPISKPMDVNSTSILETTGISQKTQKAIDFDGANCVNLLNISNDIDPTKSCLQDPDDCQYGISVSLWVKFKNTDVFVKETFLSTGLYKLGLFFGLENGVLKVTIRGRSRIWQSSREYLKTAASAEKFNLFGFMWSKINNTIKIMINDTVYTSSENPQSATQLENGAMLKLGCIDDGHDEGNLLKASVLTPSLWLWFVCDKQLLMGKTVHDLAKQDSGTTRAPPTTQPLIETDYSQALMTYPNTNDLNVFNKYNPLYTVADEYFSCKYTTIVDKHKLTPSAVWTGHGVAFTETTAVGKLADCKNDCPCNITKCIDGFTISLWIKVPTEESANQNASILTISDNISVGIAIGKVFVTIEEKSYKCDGIQIGHVTNFAFTYMQDSIVIYINGARQSHETVPKIKLDEIFLGINVIPYQNSIILGHFQKPSAANIEISDVVIWRRKMHDFESHRFFGFTAEQLTMIKMGTMYWTSDPWVNAAITKLCQLFGRCGTRSVYQLKERARSGSNLYEYDRWKKSKNPVINNNPSDIFVLGSGVTPIGGTPTRNSISLASECITDTYACITPPQPGLTVSIWLIIRSVSENKERIYLNSGSSSETDADSRGISIYTDYEKLLVTRATYKKIYSIRTDSDTYQVGQWVNLGLTWSPVPGKGCKLYLNGIDYNIMIRNGIPSSTSNNYDLSPHLMVGVFGEKAALEGKLVETVSEVANMTFADVTYFNQSLDINEYKTRIGLQNANRHYLSAFYRWQGHSLVDIDYSNLKFAKDNDLKISTEGNVEWNYDTDSAKLKNSKVILSYFHENCPGDLRQCSDGISVGGWFRMKEVVVNQSCIFFQLGHEEDNKESFGLELQDGKSMRGWIKSGGKEWITVVRNLAFRFDQWQFYALTWNKVDGMMIYINGITRSENKTSTEYNQPSTTNGTRSITVGEIYSSDSSKVPILMEVFNLVIYNYTLESQQQSRLLGIKNYKLKLFEKADIFFTFNGLYSKIQTPKPALHNIQYGRDKYEDAGAAVCTQIGKSSYVNLGNVSTTCLVDTSNCSSYILTINLKISDENQNEAVVLSSGGRVKGYKGLTIINTGNGKLNFTMRNASHTYSVNASIVLNKWVQLQLLWFKSKGLQVKADGEDKAQVMDSKLISETNSHDGGNLVVGRHSDGTEIQPSSITCVSDIMVRFFHTDTDVEAEANSIVDLSCYQNTDFHFQLRGTALDRNNRNLASTFNQHNTSIASFKNKCLNDPSKCITGITVSIWIKIDSGSKGIIFTSGAPENRGLCMTVASDDGGAKYNINATVLDGTSIWMTKAGDAVVKGEWTNVAMTWKQSTGVIIFVGGTAKARGNVPTPMKVSTDGNGDLFVGRQDSQSSTSITGSVSDLVIWYDIRAICGYPSTSKYRLEGSCTVPSAANEPQPCNLQSNCKESIGEFCLDGTKENLISTSLLQSKLRDTTTINKYFSKVINAVPTDSVPTLEAKLKLTTNAFNNWLPVGQIKDGSANMEVIDEFLTTLSDVFSIEMKNVWKSMEAENKTKDLLSAYFRSCDHFGSTVAQHLPDCTDLKRIGKSTLLYAKNIQIDLCGEKGATFTIDGGGEISVPTSALKKSSHSKVYFSAQQYNHMQDLITLELTPESKTENEKNETIDFMINSKIININVSPRPTSEYTGNEKIKLSFRNIIANQYKQSQNTNNDDGKTLSQVTSIVYYDETQQMFSDRGCQIDHQNEYVINGSCSHMTNFAALMQPIPPDNNALNRLILTILSYAGSILSLISLLIFIIVILARKELSGERYLIHLNLCVAFFLAQLAFSLTAAVNKNVNGCRAVGVMMHLFFVAGFAWLLVESLFAFYAVTAGVLEGRLKAYIPFAWGVPLIITATTAGIDISAYGHGDLCWLTMKNYFIWSFLGPILAFSFVSLLVCSIVACNIGTPAIKKSKVIDQLRSHTKQTACLMPLMIVAWLMGTMLMISPSIPIQYIFVIFNAPQGFWIFLCFGLMNSEVKAVLCRRKRNTIADSQQWENIHGHKSGIPTFHSTDSNSPPPTYRSTRSLVSSSGSENTIDRPQTSRTSQHGIQSPGFYTDPAKTEDNSGTFKYHA